jgi:hypothetical protein
VSDIELDEAFAKAIRDVRAEVTAHFVVLIGLVRAKASEDPTFVDAVRKRIDTVLGKNVAERGGTPDEREALVRKYVMQMLEVKSSPPPPTVQKKLTLRRRFLKWLDSD